MKENKVYIFDLDKIFEFVFSGEKERAHDTEITEVYEAQESFNETDDGGIIYQRDTTNPLAMINRTIREIKGTNNDKSNIKYDMIKTFMTFMNEEFNDFQNLTVSQQVILNTMLTYGFIKEI